MKTKYHGVMATLIRDTDAAVQMTMAHPDYGVMPGMWVPKSVIEEDSLEEIEESGDGDELEVFIQAWWFRKNFGEIK